MLHHLFIKYLCEQNVINICNSDIITGIWSHYSHRIDTYEVMDLSLFSDHLLLLAYGHITHIGLTLMKLWTYPYLVTIYHDIFLLNIKDMSVTL